MEGARPATVSDVERLAVLGRQGAAELTPMRGGAVWGAREARPEPLEGAYRGYTVRSNPPPGSGATLIQMLQILEHFTLGDHSSARHLDLVARAMAAAHVDRNEYLGDPRFADVPTAMLISRERAAWWAEKIERGEFPPTPTDVFVCGFCSFAAVCRKDYVGDV